MKCGEERAREKERKDEGKRDEQQVSRKGK